MAKKQNVFASLEYNALEREVKGILDYLESLDINNIQDDIEFTNYKFTVISSIEKKFLTALQSIQRCAKIAVVMYEKVSTTNSFLERMSNVVINTLENIQGYYEDRPISSITHRRVTLQAGFDKKGKPKIADVLCASKEDQIQARGKITEITLATLPLIKQLEEAKAAVTLKGGKEIPESLMYR